MALDISNNLNYLRVLRICQFGSMALFALFVVALFLVQDSTTVRAGPVQYSAKFRRSIVGRQIVNPFRQHQAPFEHPTPVRHSPSFEHPSTETWKPHGSPAWDHSTTGNRGHWITWTTTYTTTWAHPTGTGHPTGQSNSISRHSFVPTGISSSMNGTFSSMSLNATISASSTNATIGSATASATATSSSATVTLSSGNGANRAVSISAAPSASVASGSGTISSSASAISSAPIATGTGVLPPSGNGTGANAYRVYQGNGSPEDGWPTMDQWSSLTYLLSVNRPWMMTSCAQWNVPNNSAQEQAELEASIRSIGAQNNIDPRFILAIIMQESTGCVRVITTEYSHANPGLMQSFKGTGTCNNNGTVLTPCPKSEINQQIVDGVEGTKWGPGLLQGLVGRARNAQSYYIAARIYNGGTFVQANLAEPCCTPSYASDIANRLTGWTTAPRTFPSL